MDRVAVGQSGIWTLCLKCGVEFGEGTTVACCLKCTVLHISFLLWGARWTGCRMDRVVFLK